MSSGSIFHAISNYVFIFLESLGLMDFIFVLFPNEIALADVSVDQFLFALISLSLACFMVVFIIRLFFGLLRKFCEVISND